MRNLPPMNHNAQEMNTKYGISHMIIAFGYCEIRLNNGKHFKKDEAGNLLLEAQTFPWQLCPGLSKDLASMAGKEPDNKVLYLVIMNGQPTLIQFYDSTVTLIDFSNCWNRVPNVWGDKVPVINKAFLDWKVEDSRSWRLLSDARKARTFPR